MVLRCLQDRCHRLAAHALDLLSPMSYIIVRYQTSAPRRACKTPAMVPEAPLEPVDGGLVPKGDGWFVLNAREALWKDGDFGAYTRFEGESRFPQVGINIGVLQPGQPSCMYHGEDAQEDFLVLSG